MGLLVVGLLLGVMLGSGEVVATAAKAAPLTLEKVTIPAAAFGPTDTGAGFTRIRNNGRYLYTTLPAEEVIAALQFRYPVVTIRKVTLYAYDNADQAVCLRLYRTDPELGTEDKMAEFCSTGASETYPREFSETAISPRRVRMGNGLYVEVYLRSGDYGLTGVRIIYGH